MYTFKIPQTWERVVAMGRIANACCLGLLVMTVGFTQAFSAETVALSGEHFNDDGYRSDHYLSPIPDALPGGRVLTLKETLTLYTDPDVVLIDVLSAGDVEPDPFDGSWSIDDPHNNIPGSVWLPNVGRGYLDETMSRYFEEQLSQSSKKNFDAQLIFYCIDDCWMAWNAAKRAMTLGYTNVSWFRRGMTVWEPGNHPVAVARAVPVPVE